MNALQIAALVVGGWVAVSLIFTAGWASMMQRCPRTALEQANEIVLECAIKAYATGHVA